MQRRGGARAQATAVTAALSGSAHIFLAVGLFSGVINVLALTGSLYMLQVYDRVLPSHSVPTLIGLSLLMAALYMAHGLLDFFRLRVMARVGVRLDHALSDKVFTAVQLLPLRLRAGDGLQPIRDLDQIRAFLSGLGPTALFDIPWMPVYLALVYALHPLLGLTATAGALVLIALTFATELASAAPVKAAALSGAARMAFGETARRNAEAIRAMGLGGRTGARWGDLNARHLTHQLHAADAASGIGTLSRIARLLLQSGMLGLGAYLVIGGELSPGAIIAASITTSRALAPIEMAIAHWRGFAAARHGTYRLAELFRTVASEDGELLALPPPTTSLEVEGLTVAPPGATKPVLRHVSFKLAAGTGLGIIGPSASGKSTLARALVGAWAPVANGGSVRLDGAALTQWTPEALGRHIGYLPQDIALFDGTIAANIARLDPGAPDTAIVAAARAAGIHDMIVRLPDGYQTPIGEGGMALSAGQRQRLGLARALYGDPFLVVLDEPNSNLDAAGDAALSEAIRGVRRRGGIIIIIAHRPSALAALDQVLALANGQVQAFGPRDEVLAKVLKPGAGAAQQSPVPGLKIIADAPTGAAP